MSISLPDPLDKYIQQKVASGGYSSASEVVREGLRLLQQHEAEKRQWLRAALKEGEDSLDRGEGLTLEEVNALIEARWNQEDLARANRAS